ncbi:alpha-glucan family phosphorylase [Schumannella sp. 10F1B-5-1]|uniref:alpha-glucan family phosphorylase n=1 Tax=Schumannella sp. 10F1B-5-1 TaxID=2590780 RepID=UPI00112FF55C|nr:alpha-glucan family phosphorylase [Schumannella sp. 10F1B-5-1]TPW70034.1 glycosyltransferase family 1 protein [Schumannella sp. 10F1B-5-1]
MKAIRRFTVRAVLPPQLSALDDLAANLRWSWHEPTQRLFEDIAPDLWQRVRRDPIGLLGEVAPERLDELAADGEFTARAEALRDDLRRYLDEPRWYQSLGDDAPATIAYFSPEFGIAAALPQYSGGLGILAGDHLKSASDLGVPIVGVGLFYRAGYFRQSISRDGWQQEAYPVLDPDGLPMRVLRNPDGSAAQVTLALPEGRALVARVWKLDVGRVPLLLLDTDIPDNDETLRGVTDRLYGGGGEHRLLQEMLLGIGGSRAVKLYTGLTGRAAAEVFHTNEGHAGFQGLDRINDLISGGLSFPEALRAVRAGTVFTTHTPVPAGIDRFEAGLVQRYFSTELLPGVDVADVLALGAEDYEGGTPDTFNMAVMGLRLAQRANGVSKLHGEVSRGMFGALWPGFDADDVPITSVTNGVHAPTWTDRRVRALAAEVFGDDDSTRVDWQSEKLGDDAVWALRRELREQLVDDARARVGKAWDDENPGIGRPTWHRELLDPEVLTIGFARRVPTYKRLTLMLHDPERLRALLTHPERPVQLVIAGKSHPADDEGKRLIQRLVEFSREADVRERIVFLPNYDIAMAQKLYPGTDIWLNNPLRPLEACGTSGMKAALNGSLNLSILDGWWNEYYDDRNGWAIPSADSAGDAAERDALEAAALYDLIEHQIAPRFYERDAAGVPSKWVADIRHTLATLSPELSADRMLREYVERLYLPAARAERAISDTRFRPARELAAWTARVGEAWPQVHVAHVESGGVDATPQVGEELQVRAFVELGELTADDVAVELVHGRAREGDRLADVERLPLTLVSHDLGSPATYTGTVRFTRAGSFGYTVRVVPSNPLLASPAELGLVATA